MEETILICKTIVCVAMSIAVAMATYKTGKPACLWALIIVAITMAN